MRNCYLFEIGDSTTEPLGLCARILATTPEAALERLNELLESTVHDGSDVAADVEAPQEYVRFYLNPTAVHLGALVDSETEGEWTD